MIRDPRADLTSIQIIQLPVKVDVSPLKPAKREKRSCAFTTYECNLPCLDSYNYCLKHILEDPNAPYKQCSFICNINGRKCQNPAPKLERRDVSYCIEHIKKAQTNRTKQQTKHTLPECAETLLLDLKHYVKTNPDSNGKKEEQGDTKDEISNPFTEIDVFAVNTRGPDILDYASSSDSDVEPTMITDTLKTPHFDDSDNESLHSPEEDPLRHAGTYSIEESIYIDREKLMRLQSLYIDQFKRLQYTLRERKRRYLQNLKKEKETLSNIHDQPRETAKEKKMYQKLKSLTNYHKRNGVEAVLYKKSQERRAQVTTGHIQKPPSVQKCIFTEGGVKCGERVLPTSKYCRKHILKDQNQVLFKACGAIEADMQCHEPVPMIFDSYCVFHSQLPSPIKLEPMKFKEEKPPAPETISKDDMEINIMKENQEIDPDDDMAGLMREMNDVVNKKTNFNNESVSETSTDTAFSFAAQMSDDLVSM